MASHAQTSSAPPGSPDATVLKPSPSAPTILDDARDTHPVEQDARDVDAFSWSANEEDLRVLLSTWMGTNVVGNSRVWDITIPGSHNSATYEITHQEANRVLLKLASGFVRCQELDILEQLQSGIRFLDLRVCKNSNDRLKPYTAHGGYRTAPLINVYKQIREFLTAHPTEVVFLSVRKDVHAKRGPTSMSLLESDFWVSLYLGDFLGPRLRADTTIGSLAKNGQQIIYFYDEVERYFPDPSKEAQGPFTRAASAMVSRLDSLLGNIDWIPRAEVNLPEEFEKPNTLKSLIRLPSERHPRTSAAKINKNVHASKKMSLDDEFNYIVQLVDGQIQVLQEVEVEPFGNQGDERSNHFQVRWKQGLLIHGAPPSITSSSSSLSSNKKAAETHLELASRFQNLPEQSFVKLHPEDAQRFRAVGLTKEFFLYPLRGTIAREYAFASCLKTGRTFIEKSWAQTCDNNPKFLTQKLKYWTAVHGKAPPRPPYRLRILAGEVTPPSFDFPQPGSELMKFWASQSTSALFFLPSGLKPDALAANKLLLEKVLSSQIVNRVNGITHDFVSRRISLAILCHQVRALHHKPVTPATASGLAEEAAQHENEKLAEASVEKAASIN